MIKESMMREIPRFSMNLRKNLKIMDFHDK
jgi:hypothetical protein